MTTDAVTDVGDATFVAEVLERSHELPVVVDFWAPWCEPCRIIGPILEQLATEYAGRVALVKLDVDENPAVSTQYGIRSIPAVTAFRDGRPASQFVGAIPEPQARTFFESLLPTEAEVAAKAALAEAVEARAAGDVDGARDRYESVLAADGTHQAAALGLAELEYEAGDLERAEELAARWELEPEGEAPAGADPHAPGCRRREPRRAGGPRGRGRRRRGGAVRARQPAGDGGAVGRGAGAPAGHRAPGPPPG